MESSHRPDGWCFEQLSVRTEYHIVQTDSRDPIFLTWNLGRIFKKYIFENGDSENTETLYKTSVHESDFVQQKVANYKLTEVYLREDP
jgi:hypothetical protein